MTGPESPDRTLQVVTAAGALPRWAFELLTRLQLDGVGLVRLQLDGTQTTAADNRWNRLINALDRRLFPGADTASTLVPGGPALDRLFRHTVTNASRPDCTTDRGPCLLNLHNAPDHEVAALFNRPVLSLQLSAEGDWRTTPVGLWEWLGGLPVVGLRAVETTPCGGAVTRMHATECTDPVSIGRTRNAALWAGAELLYRAVSQAGDAAPAQTDLQLPASAAGPATPWAALVRTPCHVAKGAFRKFTRRNALRQWILLWRAGRDDATDLDMASWQRLLPPRDVFWADPFVVQRDGVHQVFIEEATFTPRRGHLAVLTLDEAGHASAPVTILKKPYHLSYPNVFEHEGDWYLMPESGADRSLQIYKCTVWPQEWRWQKNAMEGLAVYDGTLLLHGDRWWLFGTVQHFEASSPNVFLHLWHSDSPLGPWTPHPANPVCTDVRSARPAGNFFVQDGVLYRPSQNCGTHYGYGLQINRVDQLDTSTYRETPVADYSPWAQDLDAVHTLNRTDTLQLADAVFWRPPA